MVYLSQIPTEPLNRYRAVKRKKERKKKEKNTKYFSRSLYRLSSNNKKLSIFVVFAFTRIRSKNRNEIRATRDFETI